MLFLAVALLATPDFPGVIQQQLGLPNPPRCAICHATDSGGAGTVTKPFGIFLSSRGLRPGDEDSLRTALLADLGEKHSSNGGQTSDVAALQAGDDPNGGTGPAPSYGCSSNTGAPGLVLLLLCACWIRIKTAPSSASRNGASRAGWPHSDFRR